MQLIKDLTSFLKLAKNPLVVILGPTASGKTALSVKIAHEIDGEIISTDSCQIYRGMEIATDAVQEDEQNGIPHHLIGITDPDKTITLAEYKELAEKSIKEIYKNKKVPILCGGTGLYISAIIENYNVPKVPPDEKLRQKLEKEAKELGADHLHKKLAKLDPESAKNIHPNNIRYVIRALEINLSTKNQKQDQKAKKSPYDLFLIGIEWPREELYQRVNKRVDRQIERGVLSEVENLLKKYDPSLPSMQSLGIKEYVPYLQGEMPLEDCIEILKMNTRRYAKRQMTWFRRYQNVHWITSEELQKYV